MQADATVADQYITYPTDNGILNESLKKCEDLIDKLHEKNDKEGVKPRTYRRNMDKSYLEFTDFLADSRNKSPLFMNNPD
jgi:hypothetical protein